MDHRNVSPGTSIMVEKPRLTEQEKKNNHIASEQKRRQAIREGFDEIAEIVPGMAGHGRSEALVLESASSYLKSLLAHRWRLIQQARECGLNVRQYELDHTSMRISEQAWLDLQNGVTEDFQAPRP